MDPLFLSFENLLKHMCHKNDQAKSQYVFIAEITITAKSKEEKGLGANKLIL